MKQIRKDYQERFYRSHILKYNLSVFNVTVKETDLFISADSNLSSIALTSVHRLRLGLETYIANRPEFLTAMDPVCYDEWAPEIVRNMMWASAKAGVGPMAAVAGAIVDEVARDLLPYTRNLIIENGGDIYINLSKDSCIGLFSGNSSLNNHVFIKIRKEEMPLGVCTSSGTIGHSISLGCADACCVKSKSSALADAAATAVGNLVQSKQDIQKALKSGMEIDGALGIVIVVGDYLGVIGDMELE
jgi:ApbE superfamily uncharacterized protein (UPF0280 family)